MTRDEQREYGADCKSYYDTKHEAYAVVFFDYAFHEVSLPRLQYKEQ